MSALLLTTHASMKRHELMTNDCQCGEFKDWNKTDFWHVNHIVFLSCRCLASSSSSSLSGSRVKCIAFAYDVNLQQDDYDDDKHNKCPLAVVLYARTSTNVCYRPTISYLCNGLYIESLKATAAASWSSSSPSPSTKGPFSPCIGLLDKSCGDNEVFLPDDDDEEKRTFKKECEATDALVWIGGILLDVVQILHDCHQMRRRQIYGQSAALVRPSPKPNAKCKTHFLSLHCLHKHLVDFLEVAFLFIDRIVNTRKRFKTSLYY